MCDCGGAQPNRAGARIGANVEDPAGWVAARGAKVAGMVIDVVFVIVFARRDQAELRVRLSGGKEADLASGVAGDGQHQKRIAASAFNIDAKAFVRLFVEQRIGGSRLEDM